MFTKYLRKISCDTCQSWRCLRRSEGETLKNNEMIICGPVWSGLMLQVLVILPLWAATASLPLCLNPNTRSIHSWRCSDTYWLSSAILCLWRKSLESGGEDDRTQGMLAGMCWREGWAELTGSYLRPMVGGWRHRLSFRSAFGPNRDSVCFPENWGRSHKTQESTASEERGFRVGFQDEERVSSSVGLPACFTAARTNNDSKGKNLRLLHQLIVQI